jgi:hypothetical protein
VHVGGAADGNPEGQNAMGRSIKVRGKLKGGGNACTLCDRELVAKNPARNLKNQVPTTCYYPGALTAVAWYGST